MKRWFAKYLPGWFGDFIYIYKYMKVYVDTVSVDL
jgi:hypothetical protein